MNKRHVMIGAALLGLGLGLPHAATAGFFDKLKGTLGGEKTPGSGDTTYLEQMKAAGPRADCGGDARESRLNAAVAQGLGIVGEKQVSAYLQGIVAKLLKVSSIPDCRITVFVTPHDAAQAVALKDGGILVAIGFLRNLKNEDEVAALLGHEMSHILRNHHASDSFTETQDSFLKGLEAANASGGMLLGMVDPNIQKGVNASLSVGDALYNVSDSMIAPAWTEGQEDEADLTGTDLIDAAGYNPRAMASIMDVIAAQEANAAKVEANREKIYQQHVQGTLMNTLTTTDVHDTASIVGSVANLTSALVSGSDKKTHRPAAERKKNVEEYIRKFYSRDRRRPYTTDPWQALLTKGESGRMFAQYKAASDARRVVFTGGDMKAALSDAKAAVAGAFADDAYPRLAFSEVRLKEGNRQKALQNLEIAMKSGNAPWQIYRSYADMELAAGNTAAATEAVDRADQQYGQPLGIAPYAIKVYRAAGNQAKVNEYMQRCQAKGSREVIKVCQAAAGQTADAGGTQQPAATTGSGVTNILGGFLRNVK